MAPKKVDNQIRREQILAASLKIFSQHGFLKTRMEDIALEMGLAKGTIYLYFKSKDEIIKNSIDQLFKGEFNKIDSFITSDLSPAEKLILIGEITISDLDTYSALLPVVYEFYAYALRKKTLRPVFSKYFEAYVKRIVVIIEDGIQKGDFKPCDAREVAVSITAVVEGTILMKAYIPDAFDLGAQTRAGLHSILAGILKS